MRNKSHGEIIRVCKGIITTAPRNKKYSQILNTNTSPYIREVHRASLMYVRDESKSRQLAKMGSFNIVSGQIISDALWK